MSAFSHLQHVADFFVAEHLGETVKGTSQVTQGKFVVGEIIDLSMDGGRHCALVAILILTSARLIVSQTVSG